MPVDDHRVVIQHQFHPVPVGLFLVGAMGWSIELTVSFYGGPSLRVAPP